MKNLLILLQTLAIIAVQSIVISAFFTLCKWLLNLLGIAKAPDWLQFIGGTVGVFAVLALYCIGKTCITLYRYHKDPVFKDANLSTGIRWKDYKRLKDNC